MCKRGTGPSVVLRYCDPGTLCHEECTDTLCVHGSPKRVIVTPDHMWDAVRAARKPPAQPPKPKPVAIVKPTVREKEKIDLPQSVHMALYHPYRLKCDYLGVTVKYLYRIQEAS